nr:MATE family efflux transporter [uncultured Sellimonas sp.]
MSRTTVMTSGNIWKQILFFSIPLILGNLLQQLYNTADSIIVGNFVGSDALAAVGSSGSLINLLIAFCIGASAGAGVVIAQHYGAGDEKGVQTAVHTTIALAVIAGAVIMVLGIVASPILLKWMGTPAQVMDQSILYLRIYFGGLIFNVIYNMSAGILNAVGNSRRSLVYLAVASVSNIVLDMVFVVFFNMGVAGVAIATDISQVLSCIFILRFLVKVDDLYHLKMKEIRWNGKMGMRIIKIGLSTGIQNMVISFSNVLLQSSVNTFGAKAMAGFAAYIKVDGFNILPVMSFSMAATTFTGQNIGAGRIDRVKKGMWVTLAMGFVYTIVTGVLLLAFSDQIIGIFTSDADVVYYGTLAMWYFCPFYFILSIMHEMAGTIRGTGKTVPPMLIILFSLCVCRVLWVQFVVPYFETIRGVYLCYPISWGIGAVLMILYAWKGKWMPEELRKKQEE